MSPALARLATAVTLIAVGVAAGIWLWRAPAAAVPEADCDIVEDVGAQWYEMAKDMRHAADHGVPDGYTRDAVADRELAMADQLRRAADAVSTPQIAEQLNRWADSAVVNADLQRAGMPTLDEDNPLPPDDIVEAMRRGLNLYTEATEALTASCPALPQVLIGKNPDEIGD
ncbi:hypothetical protein H7J77_10300 [Mycolicibacillus parakoreensis]|uniref:Secreted protein n=1 Tax=Mycolicibacillus parakoreensis TaxID=1069221 RepID=A0ABY3U4I8_9MYCO|nr:hypothetical protein [Mycolicibacillus parakoreensis]MCV7315931.1 hypothetical protein [Mycolicibacillus parakoreensis]ULN52437.1 hypothetical protein MIU77_16610 [Mycolicibacillus parakoreensis]